MQRSSRTRLRSQKRWRSAKMTNRASRSSSRSWRKRGSCSTRLTRRRTERVKRSSNSRSRSRIWPSWSRTIPVSEKWQISNNKYVLETVVGHDSSMKDIMRQKQELKDERDALVKECDEHRAELEKNTERIIGVSSLPWFQLSKKCF